MKVIAAIDHNRFICEVGNEEIEKFLNLYYNKMPRLKVGDTVDLGRGYNFLSETLTALEKTEKFISANKSVVESILKGISVLGASKNEKESV